MRSLRSRIITRVETKFWRRSSWSGLILLYHRIAEVDLDPWGLCVSPRHFAEHLEILNKSHVSTDLAGLKQKAVSRFSSERSIAITFDDGYADLLYNAVPLLERNEIPASVFVTSAWRSSNVFFWWDELEHNLLRPAIFLNDRHLRWRALLEAPPTWRHELFVRLYEECKSLPPQERQEAIKATARARSALSERNDSTQRPLDLAELEQLARCPLIDIGAHSVNHPFLSLIPLSAQRDEINQNKKDLEMLFQRPIMNFAYPHGDFSEETVRLVRESGFELACTTHETLVRCRPDLLKLPRVVVGDWDGDEFDRRLRQWFIG